MQQFQCLPRLGIFLPLIMASCMCQRGEMHRSVARHMHRTRNTNHTIEQQTSNQQPTSSSCPCPAHASPVSPSLGDNDGGGGQHPDAGPELSPSHFDQSGFARMGPTAHGSQGWGVPSYGRALMQDRQIMPLRLRDDSHGQAVYLLAGYQEQDGVFSNRIEVSTSRHAS